jgi:hypothetical protein
MDDLITCSDKRNEPLKQITKLYMTFEDYWMHLCKFLRNNNFVNTQIPIHRRAETAKSHAKEYLTTTLEMVWNGKQDHWSFKQ